MSRVDVLAALGQKLDEQASPLSVLDSYYSGTQPLSFLSPKAREALGNRLRALTVGFPRLAVDALAERLRIVGFRDGQPGDPFDPVLWADWRRAGMVDGSAQAITEALTLGRSFVMVWGQGGRPTVSVESPRQVAVARDPATRQVVAAVKRWADQGKGHAVLFEPDRVTRYVSDAHVVDWAAMPSHAWTATRTLPNPLGVVPVVPLINGGRLLDADGVSEFAPIIGLTDALTKLMSDLMTSAEFHAMPRRWVTGLEITEDEDGNPVNPFSKEQDRVWIAEDAAARFGQFDAARLDGYSDAIGTITRQIGALAGLPPSYVGLHGDQPASASAIRASEASLVARALAKQRAWDAPWTLVAQLMVAVREGVDPLSVNVEPVWADASTRTPAEAADAAAKLVAARIIPVERAQQDLGYTASEMDAMRSVSRGAALDAAGVDVKALLP